MMAEKFNSQKRPPASSASETVKDNLSVKQTNTCEFPQQVQNETKVSLIS